MRATSRVFEMRESAVETVTITMALTAIAMTSSTMVKPRREAGASLLLLWGRGLSIALLLPL